MGPPVRDMEGYVYATIINRDMVEYFKLKNRFKECKPRNNHFHWLTYFMPLTVSIPCQYDDGDFHTQLLHIGHCSALWRPIMCTHRFLHRCIRATFLRSYYPSQNWKLIRVRTRGSQSCKIEKNPSASREMCVLLWLEREWKWLRPLNRVIQARCLIVRWRNMEPGVKRDGDLTDWPSQCNEWLTASVASWRIRYWFKGLSCSQIWDSGKSRSR